MIKSLSISIKTIIAILIGLFFNIIILQEDPWFKKFLQAKFTTILSDIIGSPLLFRVKKINLFEGKIIFDNLYSCDKQWEFFCSECILNLSLKNIIRTSKIDADLIFNNAYVTSNYYNSSLAVIEPIKRLVNAPFVFPCDLKNLSFKELTLEIKDPKYMMNTIISFSSLNSLISTNSIDTTIFCSSGFLKSEKKKYIENLSGYINFNYFTVSNKINDLNGQIFLDIPTHNKELKRYVIFGNYHDTKGWAEMHSKDQVFRTKLSNILYTQNDILVDLKINSDIKKLAELIQINYCPLNGKIETDCHFNFSKNTISYNGKIHYEDLSNENNQSNKFIAILNGNEKNIHSTFELKNSKESLISGIAQYDILNNYIKSKSILREPIELFGYKIQNGTFLCKLNLNDYFPTNYKLSFQNSSNKLTLLSGKCIRNQNTINLDGIFNGLNFKFVSSLSPLALKEFDLKDKNNQKLIKIKTNNLNINAEIDYLLIKDFIQRILTFELNGEGKITLDGVYDNNIFKGSLKSENSNIRIPYVYNFIKNIKAELKLDFNNKNLMIKNLLIDLYKGKINSQEATINFDNLAKLIHMHIPLNYQNCLISWKKDFFSLFSGNLTIIYNNGVSSLKGNVILDHAYLRSNLLSPNVQQDIFKATLRSLNHTQNNINLDVNIVTQKPIEVKTPFLEAIARLNVKANGSLYTPEISGHIELIQGSFAFPYKPLYITKGKIYLSPDTLDAPSVELTAKNRIKKYDIIMSATGSVTQPKIEFQSSPYLQEEQIITLLLSGSEEGSLYNLMPNLIMQNLETLFFGPAESSSQLQQYFKNLLKPLKKIRLITSKPIQNQNNLKGTIELDLSDNLYAKVQNNLNLTDQTQLELEYNLTDDISLKAVKDEQGTIGGEVEMRWKF